MGIVDLILIQFSFFGIILYISASFIKYPFLGWNPNSNLIICKLSTWKFVIKTYLLKLIIKLQKCIKNSENYILIKKWQKIISVSFHRLKVTNNVKTLSRFIIIIKEHSNFNLVFDLKKQSQNNSLFEKEP